MFYEEDEISELLMCKLCNRKLKDPRVINCGNTVCNECITAIYNPQTNGFECLFCSKFHLMPKNGFPINDLISKLSGKKPKEVYRGEIYETLKQKLEKIDGRCDDLKYDFEHIPNKIKEKCSVIRDEIDIVTNELIELITRLRSSLIKRVDNYEEECLNNYNNSSKEFKQKLADFFLQLRLFHDHWSCYLKRPNIDEMKLKKINEYSSDWLDKLEKLDNIFKRMAFNDRVMIFEMNNIDFVDSDIIGKLRYETTGNNDFKLNF